MPGHLYTRAAAVALALPFSLSIEPAANPDQAAPSIVWKGIDCGPGPIVPATPALGRDAAPAPRDRFTLPDPPEAAPPEGPITPGDLPR